MVFWARHPTPRVQDWNFTLEKEVAENTILRASYIGNHADKLEQFDSYNNATPTYIWYVTTGLPLPKGEYSGVALRPYDQTVYGTLAEMRMTGWSNFNGLSLEAERRYSRGYGFQLFYNMGNAFRAGGKYPRGNSTVQGVNEFLPGAVPTDYDERVRSLYYLRDTDIPKHRVRWNWIADLPFGKGKLLGRNAGGVLES